jgi:hypothetical protein
MVVGARMDTMLDWVAAVRCGQRSSTMAGAAKAHRSSVLHGYGAPFSVIFLPTESAGCEELTKGSSSGGELRSKTRGGEAQTPTFGYGGGKLQGTVHDKVGKNGCGAGCRTLMSG